jgi:hypothetical protein
MLGQIGVVSDAFVRCFEHEYDEGVERIEYAEAVG